MKRYISIIFLFLLIAGSGISQTRTEFSSIKKAIEATLDCIEKQDTTCYTGIVNYKAVLGMLTKRMKKDTLMKGLYTSLSEKPALFYDWFKKNFVELNTDIKKKTRTDVWKISYKDHEVENSEKDAFSDHLTIKVNIVVNGSVHYLRLYVTAYKGKFVIVEPVDTYLGT